MNELNEPKLGDKLTFAGIKLIAVEETSLSCKKCFLYTHQDGDMFCDNIRCISTERSDGKNIILVIDKE